MGNIEESPLQVGVAASPLAGHKQSGDVHFVRLDPRWAVLAAIDALGHGSEAAEIAQKAKAILESQAYNDVATLIRVCHEGLLGTRGVVMSVVWVDVAGGTLSWLGIGNVEGVLLHSPTRSGGRQREFILLQGGIVGHHIPLLRPETTTIGPGDTLVLATDGIRREFIDKADLYRPVQEVADSILGSSALRIDDALVLVARLVNHEHES